ncbi:Dabb family protein [Gilvimarinus algae]|uniref:Dabb family protein n=1 Tax=Gilvimarinus algae TaxID=3058037 RepID=A0ABT8TAP7_9GAMM|nr:Dabb family protein [Gilvimarinus sp. SDUM040014]MDO3380649.1 Dabb family protein [Gilvimarinus sp. SDUM040014]
MSDTSRRQFLAGAATVGAVAFAGGAGAAQSKKTMPPLLHNVYFWLKNPDSDTDRDALIAGLKTLAAIPTVREISIGVPASTEKREVVDNSYQVSELLMFDDVEGQNAYQVHPIHKKFVDECSHLWEKVVVYDSIAV